MYAEDPRALSTLYLQTEAHFFGAICPTHLQCSASTNAYFTGELFSPFNLLFIRVASAPRDDSLAMSLGLIRGAVEEIRIVIHENEVEALRGELMALGFQNAERTTAMVFELARLVPTIGDSPVQINLTRNMHDWAVPIGSAFLRPPQVVAYYQAQHQRALDAGQALYHFTLSMEGQVLCSLTLSICGREARLNDIGTLVAFRRKGYGTRLIHAAMLYASSLGAQRCFLEAMEGSVSLYRQLGFEDLFEFHAFVRGPIAGT